MNTILLFSEDLGTVEVATDLLTRQQAVAFPTDTVYGVGALACSVDAIRNLYAVKGRPDTKAIPVLIAGVSDLARVSLDVPDAAYRLAGAFWPGALTIVVPTGDSIPAAINRGGNTIAVRAPRHAFVERLLRHLGMPLAASSANLSGRPAPVTAGDVLTQLNGRIPLVVDGGPCTGGIPSTIVDTTVQPARILRSGAVSDVELRAIVPDIVPSSTGVNP